MNRHTFLAQLVCVPHTHHVFFPSVADLLRRSQRHPGVQCGTASRLGTNQQLPEDLLPDGPHTLREEPLGTRTSGGEDLVRPTLTGAGTVAQRGEERGQKKLQHVVQ